MHIAFFRNGRCVFWGFASYLDEDGTVMIWRWASLVGRRVLWSPGPDLVSSREDRAADVPKF